VSKAPAVPDGRQQIGSLPSAGHRVPCGKYLVHGEDPGSAQSYIWELHRRIIPGDGNWFASLYRSLFRCLVDDFQTK